MDEASEEGLRTASKAEEEKEGEGRRERSVAGDFLRPVHLRYAGGAKVETTTRRMTTRALESGRGTATAFRTKQMSAREGEEERKKRESSSTPCLIERALHRTRRSVDE